ncbi:MAG: glycosyltransferase family 2 protein [Bacteroidota bacterium]
MAPLVSIIAVNFRKAGITCDFLDSLNVATYPNYELLLVDNGMLTDEQARFEAHHPQVRVIKSTENLGFAGGNNLAIRQAQGKYLLLINNDTIVPPSFLEPMVAVMEADEKVGLVSPKIYYHDQPNMLQYAGRGYIEMRTGRGRDTAKHSDDQGQFDEQQEAAFAHGACMLIRTQLLEEVGLLREDYFMYYEELDFSVRARQAGWKIVYTPDAYIHHRESSSMGKFSPMKTYYMFRNRWLFVRRFGSWLDRVLFAAYFLIIGIPVNLLRFALKREWPHVKAIWEGLGWNLKYWRKPADTPAL